MTGAHTHTHTRGPVAICGAGRAAWARLILALAGEHAAEILESRHLPDQAAIYLIAAVEPASLLRSAPRPPGEPVRCPARPRPLTLPAPIRPRP